MILDKNNFNVSELKDYNFIKDEHINILGYLISNFNIRIIISKGLYNNSVEIHYKLNLYGLDDIKVKHIFIYDVKCNLDEFGITILFLLKHIDNTIINKINYGLILNKHLPHKILSKKLIN